MDEQPTRIQLRRTKGWRMPFNTVKVDRTTPWGNPFRVDEPPDQKLLARWGWAITPQNDTPCGTTEIALSRFRACILFDSASHHAARRDLAGRNLACWCAIGAPCHADLLLRLANEGGTHA